MTLYSLAIDSSATPSLATDLDRRLVRLNRLLRARARGGMTLTALSVLRRLADEGPSRVTELATAEAVAQPTMTTLVSRLEARGLARREHDPADRRAVLVTVTDSGREQVRAIRAARAALLHERLAELDEHDRAALAAALPALDRLMDSL